MAGVRRIGWKHNLEIRGFGYLLKLLLSSLHITHPDWRDASAYRALPALPKGLVAVPNSHAEWLTLPGTPAPAPAPVPSSGLHRNPHLNVCAPHRDIKTHITKNKINI